MMRWMFCAGLAIGLGHLLGCEQRSERPAIERVDDSPLLGTWYLQATGDRPVAIDTTIRFEFSADGVATYERTTNGPEAPDRYELTYNLSGQIISIDGQGDAPDLPRITGKIEPGEDGQSLRISTHTQEDWLLTRAKLPGGEVQEARRVPQVQSMADPMLVRVQSLAYACNTYTAKQGRTPEHMIDLVSAGLVRPEELTRSGNASDLPARFDRMAGFEQAQWLDAHSAFAFFFRYAGSGQASSVVVCTLPQEGKPSIVVGMANGAVYIKPAKEAAQLLQYQLGSLPPRWPDSAWSREATAGLEPLSD